MTALRSSHSTLDVLPFKRASLWICLVYWNLYSHFISLKGSSEAGTASMTRQGLGEVYQPSSCNNFEEKRLDSTLSSKNGGKEFAEKVGSLSLYVICLCESIWNKEKFFNEDGVFLKCKFSYYTKVVVDLTDDVSSCGESNTPTKEEKSWCFTKVRELFLTIEKKKELDYNRRNLVLQREHNVLTWNILICTYGS